MSRYPAIELWDCGNGATFQVRGGALNGEQTGTWNVGRCQRDTNGRWTYGGGDSQPFSLSGAWHAPARGITPELRLEDLADYRPVLAELWREAGFCRN